MTTYAGVDTWVDAFTILDDGVAWDAIDFNVMTKALADRSRWLKNRTFEYPTVGYSQMGQQAGPITLTGNLDQKQSNTLVTQGAGIGIATFYFNTILASAWIDLTVDDSSPPVHTQGVVMNLQSSLDAGVTWNDVNSVSSKWAVAETTTSGDVLTNTLVAVGVVSTPAPMASIRFRLQFTLVGTSGGSHPTSASIYNVSLTSLPIANIT